MEFEDVARGRRSIRKFKPDPVPEELLREIVERGTWAPSASNMQAWRFGLITDPTVVRQIDRFSPGMGGNPPALIAVCSDLAYAQQRCGNKADELATMDASLAAENIMLAAYNKGLGTCAIKSYNDAVVRKILQLPESIHIELLITVGYPDHDPKMPRRKGLDVVAFSNVWPNSEERDA